MAYIAEACLSRVTFWDLRWIGVTYQYYSSLLLELEKSCATYFWLPWFLMKDWLSFFFPLVAFKIFNWSLSFQNWIMMCHGMNFFVFILSVILLASGICKCMSVAKFGEFSAIILAHVLSASPFLFFQDSNDKCCIFCPTGLWGLVHFHSVYFLSVFQTE